MDWIVTHRAGHLTGQWRSPEVGAVPLGEYAAEYLISRVDLAPRTQDNYRRQLDSLVCADLTHPAGRRVDLSGVLLRDLTPALVREWHAAALHTARQRAAERLAAVDRRRRARALCAARTWAIGQGLDVKRTGRLPAAVVEAWRTSGAPAAATYDLPDTEPPRDAGRVAVAHAYTLLRSILATAHRDGLILANPCTVKGAGSVAPAERPIASPAQVARLAQHMPERFRAAVVVAAWSSLRASELFALTRAHVDLDRGTLRVERALLELPGHPIRFQQPKTRKSVRTVHLPTPVVEVLRDHLATHVPAGPDRLVFARADGLPLRAADRTRMFRAACATEGLHTLRWHDLRHTGATMFTQAGASLREVQARLGHATAAAAMTYQHATPERDREVTEQMTARMAGLDLSNPQPSPLRVVG